MFENICSAKWNLTLQTFWFIIIFSWEGKFKRKFIFNCTRKLEIQRTHLQHLDFCFCAPLTYVASLSRHPVHIHAQLRPWARHNKAKRVNVCGTAITICRCARLAAEPYFIVSNIIAIGIHAPRILATRYWLSHVRAISRWDSQSTHAKMRIASIKEASAVSVSLSLSLPIVNRILYHCTHLSRLRDYALTRW